jgi:hypothetical protein
LDKSLVLQLKKIIKVFKEQLRLINEPHKLVVKEKSQVYLAYGLEQKNAHKIKLEESVEKTMKKIKEIKLNNKILDFLYILN